jgi:hypothetical protein
VVHYTTLPCLEIVIHSSHNDPFALVDQTAIFGASSIVEVRQARLQVRQELLLCQHCKAHAEQTSTQRKTGQDGVSWVMMQGATTATSWQAHPCRWRA